MKVKVLLKGILRYYNCFKYHDPKMYHKKVPYTQKEKPKIKAIIAKIITIHPQAPKTQQYHLDFLAGC